MSTILKINTTQNVNLDFATASIGVRIMSFIIDSILKAAYYFIIFQLLSSTGILNPDNYSDPWSFMAVIILFMVPVMFYTLILESLLEGQTVGKRIMKIKVVKIDGFQAGFGDYFARWIMMLIDIWTMSGVIGILSIIISSKNQRLGDIVAGTAVINLKRNTHIDHTILMHIDRDYQPMYPSVAFLSDRDASIIKNNYDKAIATNDLILIAKLRAKLEDVLKVNAAGIADTRFITDVLRDFNYYTQSK